MKLEAIFRAYNEAGRIAPSGTLIIEPVPGSVSTFQSTLHSNGRDVVLPVIHQERTRNMNLALFSKAFGLLAERE